MRELEVEHGGLVKGMFAKKREKKRREQAAGVQRKAGSPAGPGGRLTSFKGGLDALTTRLGERLQPILRTSHTVSHVIRDENGWTVFGKAGEMAQTRRLIVTCPTFVATKIFKDYDHDLSVAFGAVSYAPIVVVATGHRREDIAHSLNGFGFLIPRHQRIRTLGSIWTSSIFANRAPEGHVQLRTMFGGAGDKSALELNDEELWQTIRRELGPLIGIKADPVFTRIYRWERGIPQYILGHRDRRARLEEHAARHPGLYFAGNAYYGVGLNDCVKMAKSVADRILQEKNS
jgi:oxygen-dependent protoporphyrinogen oxidase